MKTPREILLSRHASENRALDEIRRQVVAGVGQPAHTEPETATSSLLQVLWDLRRQLAPLTALWLIVIGFQLAADMEPGKTTAGPGAEPRELLLSARENRRQLMELIGSDRAAQDREPNPARPRTERRSGNVNPQPC